MLLSKLISEIRVLKSNVSNDTNITGISEKSKLCKEGFVFVCIRGIHTDGNKYIDEALNNGAVCVISDVALDDTIPHIQVENARATLSRIWAAWYDYPARDLKIIGITGTNGKTSTAYMLKSILDRASVKAGLIGTVRYISGQNETEADMTTPDPEMMQKLLSEMRENGYEYVVCEVSSHALALDKLDGIEFEIGIFTNLSQDHLDFHGTMEEYYKAKKKLFSMCRKAVVNTDNMYGKRLFDEMECRKKISCSIDSNDADICAKNIRTKESSVEYEFLAEAVIYRICCPVPGIFSVYNSLLAAAAADSIGIEANFITEGIRNMGMVLGRMERIETDRDFSIIIDFAHTPGALLNVLNSIREYANGRIVCLFGCGGDRDKSKRAVMGKIAAENSDYVIITSDNSRNEDPLEIINDILSGVLSVNDIKNRYITIENREEAIRYAIKNAKKDDTILLAGKGHENYLIDASGKHMFDERKIIKDELLKEKK